MISDVGLNWTRTGFFRIAQRMGAVIVGDLEEPGTVADDEPVGDLDVAHGPLEGTTVLPEEVPLAIDELTLVALLGAFADGETVVAGAEELRHKESDRIAGVVEGLTALGADIEDTGDGFVVRGDGEPAARAARSTRAATTGWPCSARWPAWPRGRGGGRGDGGGGGLLPRVRAGPRGPARAGRLRKYGRAE